MQLVDEEDRVLGAADLVHHGLDPLFELAAVLRAGDHHRQIEDHDPPVHEQLGDVPLDDPLGEPLDDRRLAHARLAQEHGVVLRAAAEDLHRPLDFLLAADHGIELPLPGQFGQVAAETVQGRRLRFAGPLAFALSAAAAPAAAAARPLRALAAFHAVSQEIEDLFADFFQLEPEVH